MTRALPLVAGRRPRRPIAAFVLSAMVASFVAHTVVAEPPTAPPIVATVGEAGPRISPMLLGMNLGFAEARDSRLADGRIAELLREAGVGALRYPGGTETSYFHWRLPGAPPYRDAWEDDPSHWSYLKDRAAAEANTDHMDPLEFVAFCRSIDAEPIVGVNVFAGLRHNRLDDAVADAAALVHHLNIQHDADVRHWYVGNELWHSNKGEHKSDASAYLTLVGRFSEAMRAVDPSIRVIADWHSWSPLVGASGSEPAADAIDMHWYWEADAPIQSVWEHWRSQTPMRTKHRDATLVELAERVRQRSGLEPIVLEYSGGGHFSPETVEQADLYQGMLITAEMLQQMMAAGIEIACIYPGLEQSRLHPDRNLFDPVTLKPFPKFHLFAMLRPALGGTYHSVDAGNPAVVAFLADQSAESPATAWLYLLNKSDQPIGVHLPVRSGGLEPHGGTHLLREPGTDRAAIESADAETLEAGTVVLPAFSFTRIDYTTKQETE